MARVPDLTSWRDLHVLRMANVSTLILKIFNVTLHLTKISCLVIEDSNEKKGDMRLKSTVAILDAKSQSQIEMWYHTIGTYWLSTKRIST